MNKETLKNKALTKLTYSDNLLVGFATGVGKSRVGVEAVDIYLNGGRFLWLVPEIPLIKNAKDEFIKWGKEDLIQKGDFVCYASIGNMVTNEYSIIILDEVHNCLSGNRIDSLSKIKTKKRVGLTATINEEEKKTLSKVCTWTEENISLSESIEQGILPTPTVHILRIDLDDKEKTLEYYYKKGQQPVKCTQREYYDRLSKQIATYKEQFEEEGNKFAGNKMRQLGMKRQQFLAECKEKKLQQIIDRLGNERYICFCGSVEQAKKFGGDNTCSSKSTKSKNEKTIAKFNNGEINNIFAKEMLKEGINLVNTKYGIVVQLGNSSRDLVQQLGRTIRHKTPIFVVIIANNTVDERFLTKSFAGNEKLLS